MPTTNYLNITSDAAFHQYMDRLAARGVREIALDFEGEFNLHVYGNHLCLIQVFDGQDFVIVDPFKVGQAALKRFLEEPSIAKIIYDCASDGALVAEEFGIKLGPVIDLKPAVDLLAFPKRDLSTILFDVLGIAVIKKKKFQMYNWMTRPISHEAMEYALNDVRELYRLKDELLSRLDGAGLRAEWEAKNLKQQPDGLKKQRTPRLFKTFDYQKLRAEEKKRFDELFRLREAIAKDCNLPPNSVVENAQLFDLVRGRLAIDQVRFNRRLPDADCRRVVRELGAALQ